jgi:hypothetical protein
MNNLCVTWFVGRKKNSRDRPALTGPYSGTEADDQDLGSENTKGKTNWREPATGSIQRKMIQERQTGELRSS